MAMGMYGVLRIIKINKKPFKAYLYSSTIRLLSMSLSIRQ